MQSWSNFISAQVMFVESEEINISEAKLFNDLIMFADSSKLISFPSANNEMICEINSLRTSRLAFLERNVFLNNKVKMFVTPLNNLTASDLANCSSTKCFVMNSLYCM